MVLITRNSSYQMFNGSGAERLRFARPINRLLVTVDGSTTISFDDGDTYMTLVSGTYMWDLGVVRDILFGAGTWSGCGIAL